MVSPILINENKEKTRKIIGDGQKIQMRRNSDSLIFIGSGNTITIDNNEGFIKIVGDGCKLCVENGNGSVEYNGDGGILKTGKDIKIKYKGDGGRIVSFQNKKVRSCEEINCKNNKQAIFFGTSNFKVSTSRNSKHFVHVPSIEVPNIKILAKKS